MRPSSWSLPNKVSLSPTLQIADFKKSSGIDVSKDPLAVQRLREAAEKAKRELDGLAQTEVSLPFLTADASGPKHMNTKISRSQFEALVNELIERTIGPCKACLKDSGIAKVCLYLAG